LIELPELVAKLKEKYGTEKPTIKTGLIAQVDFVKSEIKVGELIYKINSFGKMAQEIIVADGLENWVRKNLK
jgi:homoaconitate hydratase